LTCDFWAENERLIFGWRITVIESIASHDPIDALPTRRIKASSFLVVRNRGWMTVVKDKLWSVDGAYCCSNSEGVSSKSSSRKAGSDAIVGTEKGWIDAPVFDSFAKEGDLLEHDGIRSEFDLSSIPVRRERAVVRCRARYPTLSQKRERMRHPVHGSVS
jgi:hypothetical protein